MINANTPSIAAIDPRGLSVRGVAYHRRNPTVAVPQSYVTQQTHDVAGRAAVSRDPRLFLLQHKGQSGASQINLHSLSGALLLSDNNDAGWRLGLMGEDGASVEGWDQKLSHSRLLHDNQRRPVTVFENAHDGPERCIARFCYAGATTDAEHNQRGQLIRHDDSAGTLHFLKFGLAGAPLEHSRTFVKDPQWPVDWPPIESERDVFLEDQPAVTRVHCNAAGEPVRQSDAQGNLQTFSHTRAGQLREIRLTLADTTDELTVLSEIQYNALGLVERQRAGNGVISSATFSPEDGRLQQLKAGVPGQPALQDLRYVYDPAGNITCLTDAASPVHFHRNQRIETSNRYAYDSLYRLIEASGRQLRNAPGGPQLPDFQSAPDPGQLENYRRSYAYDEAGNLRVMHHQAGDANRTEHTAIGQANNRSLPQKPGGELPDETEIAAGYDANGNRAWLQPGQSLRWNLRNQLCQVEQIIRQDAPDDVEFYCYEGSGQRLRKIRQTFTGTLTRTHETRYLPGLEIRTSAEEILQVITVKAGRGTVQILHWQKKPESDIPQDQQRYSFSDHLNSSTLELDAGARLISWENYYPYGSTCWWAGRSELEASYKTIRYSGQERDATGLYYYGFRYYAPWCQRWLSADPVGVADGLNLYAFVHANPVGHMDIAGLIDDHSSQNTQLREATSSAFIRDFISRVMGALAQMTTVAALNTLTPARATNAALEMIAGILDAIAVGIVGAGLAARIHRNALPLGAAAGLVAGSLPAALSSAGGQVDDSELELNQTAIGRIGAAVGAIIRETSQQILRGHGANFPWGQVSLRERLPVIHRTFAVYAVTNAINGAVGRFLPEPIRSWMAPLIEGIDGAVGTRLRGRHPATVYSPGTAAVQTPPAFDTFFGSAGRIASGFYGYAKDLAIEAVATGITGFSAAGRSMIANVVVGAVGGALSAVTEYRGPVMQAVQDGYSRVRTRAVNDMTSDVQSTESRFHNRPVARRNSFHI